MTKFRDVKIGQAFDFINDAEPQLTSFWHRCIKTGARTYENLTGVKYRIGSVNAKVYHVGEGPHVTT